MRISKGTHALTGHPLESIPLPNRQWTTCGSLPQTSDAERTKSENRATLLPMAARSKLTPVQVLERLQHRLEKRMEALQRVKLDGFQMVISELETEMDYLRGGGQVSGRLIRESPGVKVSCSPVTGASRHPPATPRQTLRQ
jgi:hypothetical protein